MKLLRRNWWRAAWDWIHNFVAALRINIINNIPIYMAECSQFVWVGPLDPGSRPSLVDVWNRFTTFLEPIPNIFEDSSLKLWSSIGLLALHPYLLCSWPVWSCAASCPMATTDTWPDPPPPCVTLGFHTLTPISLTPSNQWRALSQFLTNQRIRMVTVDQSEA